MGSKSKNLCYENICQSDPEVGRCLAKVVCRLSTIIHNWCLRRWNIMRFLMEDDAVPERVTRSQYPLPPNVLPGNLVLGWPSNRVYIMSFCSSKRYCSGPHHYLWLYISRFKLCFLCCSFCFESWQKTKSWSVF